MSILFTFRNKFLNAVSSQDIPAFQIAFGKFCEMNSNDAILFLWQLTYTAEEMVPSLLEKIGLNLEIIPFASINTLRNELRIQYTKVHRDFLDVAIPEDCTQAFTDLVNQSDKIIAHIVYNHCQKAVYADDSSFERTLYLLQSDKESHYFGGIRSLGFNKSEANYLKPYHMQISILLKMLREHTQTSSFSCTPFAGLKQKVADAGIPLPSEIEEKVMTVLGGEECEAKTEQSTGAKQKLQIEDSAQTFTPLTAEAILAQKDVFTSFVEKEDLNVLFQIGQLGFDLNEVMSKKDFAQGEM